MEPAHSPLPRRRTGLPPGPGGVLLRLAAAFVLLLPGCRRESCLGGETDCRVAAPCAALRFTCDDSSLEIKTLGDETVPGGWDALGARGDVLLGNGRVAAVVAGLGNQNYLDPNGGALLDLGNRGRNDDGLNQVLQVVGILPEDSVHYDTLTILDERPERVAVQLRGTLLHRPDLPVHTLYELRPCDPGVRIRTEVVNGAPDPQLWALSDGYYWSKREPLPFTPAPGSGFDHPSFNLLTINDAFLAAPYLAAASHSPPEASYAAVGCNQDLLEGFHSETVSAAGRPRRVIPPRGYEVFERFLAVAPGGGVGGAVDLAMEARRQLGGERLVTLSGQVERALPVGGEREASVLVSEGTLATPPTARTPWTQVVPAPDGRFAARLPAGRSWVVEVHTFGVRAHELEVARLDGDRDLGPLPARDTARLQVTVKDADRDVPLDAEVYVVPADEATRADVGGTLHGQFERCAPWLGPPPGASPACNRFLVWHGQNGPTPVELLPGRYHLYAFHGPFYTLARKTLDVQPGEVPVDLSLRAVAVRPQGVLSADLHVHGAASFDSSIPDPDRVLSFAAADVDVIIATDHDVAYDYAPVVEQLGLTDRLTTVVGVETTGHVPFLHAPGSAFPLVIGHYNFWPLRYQPTLPRNGAPFDEFIEPGALFDRVEPLFTASPSIIQLNHPWAAAEFGRDLGFPRAIGVSLLRDLPAVDDGTAQGMYVRAPAGGHANDDQHAQEVMNGTQNDVLLAYRAFWFYTLNQGRLRTGTANSDSHSLTDNTIGSPRNLVYTDARVGPGFDVGRFNQAIRDGAILGTNGPIVRAELASGGQTLGFGLRPIRPTPDAQLQIEVAAAPWVPVEEIRIVVNGQVVRTLSGSALSQPADPFSNGGLVRYAGAIPLAELLPTDGPEATRDAWVVVEAGAKLPLAGDLGGGPVSDGFPNGAPDGVPDTTDNNGDGRVDRSDVAPGEKVGPLANPPPPTDDADPRFHFAQVVTGGYPMAFTNPFVLDRDGNGRFDAPGVAGGRP